MISAKLRQSIFLQVIIALIAGTLAGWGMPHWADSLKPLGDEFVKLIKIVTAPVVFMMVVQGIASNQPLRNICLIFGKTLIYFEIVTFIALMPGLFAAKLTHIGSGLQVNSAVVPETGAAVNSHPLQGPADFFLNLIPDSFVGAFTHGDILQVLLISILFGVALTLSGEPAKPVLSLFNSLSTVMFTIKGILVRFAPLGVFGAVTWITGHYGLASLRSLLWDYWYCIGQSVRYLLSCC